jgi:hypothetical protein
MSMMMMNERVEIGGGVVGGGAAGTVDEKLATLHRMLKRIAKARAHLDLQEAEALREAQHLRLWRQFGHTSLADYMVQELGYSSHRVAEERLRLANALPALPKISEAIQNGELNFSQARELARVATPETEQAWIGKAQSLNVREVEKAVAGHAKGDLPDDPIDPKLVRKTLWLSVRPETEVMFREAKQAVEKERGERLDEDAVLEALCRAFLSGARTSGATASVGAETASVPRGTETASVPRGAETASVPGSEIDVAEAVSVPRGSETASVPGSEIDSVEGVSVPRGAETDSWEQGASAGAAPYRVAVTVCSECSRGWQHGGGVVEEMTPAAVERAQCDAQWIGDLNSTIVERARQEISPATRRKVLHRDQGRCQVPGCRAHANLDVHHIKHREHGGTNDLWNLITLCEAHHLCHHEGTLAIERVSGELRFRREGSNAFTRATRIVATKEALRERACGRDEIVEVMQRTIAHVGANELSEQEWIAAALRYADALARRTAGASTAEVSQS